MRCIEDVVKDLNYPNFLFVVIGVNNISLIDKHNWYHLKCFLMYLCFSRSKRWWRINWNSRKSWSSGPKGWTRLSWFPWFPGSPRHTWSSRPNSRRPERQCRSPRLPWKTRYVCSIFINRFYLDSRLPSH